MKKFLLPLITVFLIGCSNGEELTYEEHRELKEIEAQYIDWRTDIEWEEMVRNADELEDEYVEFVGMVISVTDEDGYDMAQILLNGDPDKSIMVAVYDEHIDQNIIKGDWINIRGRLYGITEYETVAAGVQRSPVVLSELVDFYFE